MTTINPEILAARENAARALGLNPSTIAWPCADGQQLEPLPIQGQLKLDHLSDEEWDLIWNTGILPDEPRQASMTHRELVDAVLTVVGRGRAWTELDGPVVRRRRAQKVRTIGPEGRLAGPGGDGGRAYSLSGTTNGPAHRRPSGSATACAAKPSFAVSVRPS